MGFQVSGMRRVAAILKASGIRVTEVNGWATRGHSRFDPRAVVCHWTAATSPVTALLVHGRPGIPGPLCNFEVLPGRGGVRLVAAGKANHAGVARSGFTNSVAFGIEAAGPPISDDEFRVYHALVAAICKVYGLPVHDRVRDHREVALPFGRKVDISSRYDMGRFRARVAGFARPAAAFAPRPAAKGARTVKGEAVKFPGVRKIGMHGRSGGPGAFIAMIQARLNALGATPKLTVDGDFGPKTRDAVKAFQEHHNLHVDGVVDARTWHRLEIRRS